MENRYNELMANRIKATRLAAGLKADEVAKKVGINTSRLLNWECGIRTPKIDILPKIADAVGCSAAYLAGFTDHQGESSDSWRYIVPNGESPAVQASASDFISFHVDELRRRDLPERDILTVKVRDNALMPELREGDVVLIDRRKQSVDAQGIFAIRDANGAVWLRWIRPEMTGGFTIYTADKQNFPDQHFTSEQLAELNIVGRKVGHWHWDQ